MTQGDNILTNAFRVLFFFNFFNLPGFMCNAVIDVISMPCLYQSGLQDNMIAWAQIVFF